MLGIVCTALHVPKINVAMVRTYLDITGCGIGNVVLVLAMYRHRLRGHHPEERPVVYHPEPESFESFIDTTHFEFVRDRPCDRTEFDKAAICNLKTLCEAHAAIRSIVLKQPIPSVVLQNPDIGAGFSIRVGDPRHDAGHTFMTQQAIEAMLREMHKYPKVLVCTNDSTALNAYALSSHVVFVEHTDGTCRNTESHWEQWHALAVCPVVYHGIAMKGDGSRTSTFAPTAAVYGGRCRNLIGVDNAGRLYSYEDDTYRW